jgi:hypothetical protein
MERVQLSFADSVTGVTVLTTVTTNANGTFAKAVTIPANATLGKQAIKAQGLTSKLRASHAFTVT